MTMMFTWPDLLLETLSMSTALLEPGSVLMFMEPVPIGGHVNVCVLGHHLWPCLGPRNMLQLVP